MSEQNSISVEHLNLVRKVIIHLQESISRSVIVTDIHTEPATNQLYVKIAFSIPLDDD